MSYKVSSLKLPLQAISPNFKCESQININHNNIKGKQQSLLNTGFLFRNYLESNDIQVHNCTPGVRLESNDIRFHNWPRHAFDQPVEIVPGLWLSGIAFDSDVPSWCKKNGFTHIVNAAGINARTEFYKTQPQDHGIQYLELDMIDVPHFGIASFISKLYKFISEAHETKGKILVHCIWGQSRSVSCLLYFLMMNRDINYDAALSLIRRSRPAAAPNIGFELQLRLMDVSRRAKMV